MDTNNIIVYLPPVMLGVVAFAFLLLWHVKISTSWQWSAAFAQAGLGFALVPFPVSPTFDIFVAGLLYIGAAYCYGSAILLHFGAPMQRSVRRLFVGGYIVVHTIVVLILESLKAELFLTDVAFACLLGFALFNVVTKVSNLADRAMIISGVLLVLDTLTRTVVFTFLIRTSDQMADFAASDYNLAVTVTTITIGLSFPFTAMGAMASAAIRGHREASERDPLTGLLNRRGFELAVHRATKDAVARGAVIVCDIDNFKQVNDGYGHAAGDNVIAELAAELQSHLGSRTVTARFGGEEFVAFLPHTSLAEASVIAHSVRIRFAGRDWHQAGIDRQITASFGVASIVDGEVSEAAAIERADRALYAAKTAGRNRVEVAGGEGDCLESVNVGAIKTPPSAALDSAADSRMSAA
ncbi:GGDEF domain-containing protein [Ensifer adhaerens]|uniref:GGDEF domain-containing protein n=1 Tax=Ensifer adhaerens TaxID=106592 RepID=UPI0023A9DDA6|nr:GGDEF domain-containing protein [Ensifer adhaerens]WDZ77151.1 GGDEF domain-containing protein [Ensifer adhaerens]